MITGSPSIDFPLVRKAAIAFEEGPSAQLDDNERLALKLPDGKHLCMGQEGVSLHLSWTSSLRDDTRGKQSHDNSIQLDQYISYSGYYTSAYGSPVDGQRQKFALTHFEPNSARKAYPSWDEPSFKATFSISMIVQDGLKCLSCMPETISPSESQHTLTRKFVEQDGWKTIHFERTPPVSS